MILISRIHLKSRIMFQDTSGLSSTKLADEHLLDIDSSSSMASVRGVNAVAGLTQHVTLKSIWRSELLVRDRANLVVVGSNTRP
jgi:hypothetical protein